MIQKYVIGIDISKSKVDCVVMDFDYNIHSTKIVANNKKALSAYFKATVKELKLKKDEIVICAENTGIYNRPLEMVCTESGISLWVEHALKIKRASTDMRGKDDKTDSIRIATYCVRYFDKMIPYREDSEVIRELNILVRSRETLIGHRVALENQINEAEKLDSFEYKTLIRSYKTTLKALKKSIESIERKIENLTEKDEEIKENKELLTSIKGVGNQVALGMIIATNNFKDFTDAKHLACYAGVVPFKNESGTIRKRPRISKMANKNLKRLLHLAAMSAIRYDEELKNYYTRKVAEGKNKMSVLNAVRNKLVHRIMAVINRKTPYLPINEFSLKKETKRLVF